MNHSPSNPNPAAGLDFSAAIAVKRADAGPTTLVERVAELSLVCRDAAALEHCQRLAGQPAAEQAPWPASTVEFFRKQARKFHG